MSDSAETSAHTDKLTTKEMKTDKDGMLNYNSVSKVMLYLCTYLIELIVKIIVKCLLKEKLQSNLIY